MPISNPKTAKYPLPDTFEDLYSAFELVVILPVPLGMPTPRVVVQDSPKVYERSTN